MAKSLWDSECSHGGVGESSLTSGLSDQNIWKLNVLGKKNILFGGFGQTHCPLD